MLRDQNAKFCYIFLFERRVLVVSSEDMEPTKFESMRKAAKAIGIREGVIRYAKNIGRDFMRRCEDGSIRVFP